MMCSGILLEEMVKEFSRANNKEEWEVWKIINNIHIKEYHRDMLYEKSEYEKENNLGDTALSQQFARTNTVSNATRILKGLENCIKNGWELE